MRPNIPTCSIAMCTFNGARFLQEQLDGFVRQTLKPTELVVCDDRSTDATIAILENFKHSAPFPIRLVVNPETLRSTQNFDKALHLCRGQFIALSDQDDVWQPNKLEVLIGLLQETPDADGIFTDARLIDAEGHPTGKTLWETNRFNRKTQQFFSSSPATLLLKRDVATGATMVIRSRLLQTFDHIPPSWIHDGWLTWMMVIHSKVLMSCEPLTDYRTHSSQQLGTGPKTLAERIRVIRSSERSRYERVAGQFEDLRNHLLAGSEKDRNSALAATIVAKVSFLRKRAHLPTNLIVRLLVIASRTKSYHSYARGFHSMRKDLIL